MALEGFSRKLDQRMNPAAHASESTTEDIPNSRLTLAEIRSSKDKEFGAYISTMDAKKSAEVAAVWERYLEGKSTEPDLKQLTKIVDSFNDQTEEAERVVRTFEDYLPEIIGASPAYKELARAYGADKLQEVVKRGIVEFAYSDRKKYTAIDAKFSQLEALNTQERSLNSTVAAFCEKHQIVDDELVEAMSNRDADARQKAIQLLMRHKMNTWERLKDTVKNHVTQGGTRSHSLGMATRHGDFVSLEKNKDLFLKAAGSALAGLVSKNDQLRQALLHAELGTTPEIQAGIQAQMGMSEVQSMKADLADFERFATEFKTEKIVNWDHMTSDQQDRAYDTAWSQYEKKIFKDKPGGFWSVIARILFGKQKTAMKSTFMNAKNEHHA